MLKSIGAMHFCKKSHKNNRTPKSRYPNGYLLFCFCRKGLENLNASVRWTLARSRLDGNDTFQNSLREFWKRVPFGAKEFANDPEAKAKIDQEVTADLAGDYFFTNKDFIKELLAEDKNVFQKAWNEVKYLARIATAGSEQKRLLEQAKREYQKAWNEGSKASGETKYSLSDVKVPTRTELELKNPVEVVDISTPQTKGSFSERRRQILANVEQVISKPYRNKDTGAMIFLTEKSFTHAFNNLGEVQINAAEHLPELIENAVLVHAEKPTHGSEYATGVYTFFAAAKADLVRPVKLKVKEYTYSGQDLPKNIKAYFEGLPEGYAASYDTVVLEVEEIEKSSSGSAKDMNQEDSFLSPDELSTIKVADLLNLVKGDAEKYVPAKFSLSDSDGKELTKEQQEYFKDSKVRDENGNLKVMYHGTPNGDFTIFKDGTYFTENKEYADTYQNPGASSISTGKTAANPKTFEVYLDIKKPFDISDPEAREIYINDYIKGGNAMGINPYLSDAEYAKIDTIDWTEGEDLREFLIDNGYDYDGLVLDEGATGGYGEEVQSRGKSYVVFSPEQVKSVDNLKPTADTDIRYSLSENTGRVFYTPRGIEVVQNPTSAEYRQMREDIYKEYPWLRNTGEAILRHTYDEEGNEYYWNAFEGMHRDVEPYINKRYNTRTSQQWKWYESRFKDDYPTDYSDIRFSLSENVEQTKSEYQQAWNEGSGDVKFSIYNKPSFTKDEWAIVNRRKHSEFDNPAFDLDNDKKWMYANEKGSTVFAVYSKHDADDPTVLYGSHGKKAENDYSTLSAFLRGEYNARNTRTNQNRRTLNGILDDLNRSGRYKNDGLSPTEGRTPAVGDVQLPFAERGSNGRGNPGNGAEDIGPVSLTEYNDEASENSGASFTFSNDYQAIRNFMKEDGESTRYSLSNVGETPKEYGRWNVYGKDIMHGDISAIFLLPMLCYPDIEFTATI